MNNELRELLDTLFRVQGEIADAYGAKLSGITIGEAAVIAKRIESARRATKNLRMAIDAAIYK